MFNEMFQAELTDEELQQVTGGVPAPTFGGGGSTAGYTDPNTGYFVGSTYGMTGTGSTGAWITFNGYTGAPNGSYGTSYPGGAYGAPSYY